MTKKGISDMIMYKIYGGVPDSSGAVDERDIWDAIDHKVNSILKTQQFNMNLPSGGTIPENLLIATYENVSVTKTANERSKCTLPVTPISLPRNMGIHEIRPVISTVDSGDRLLGDPFIPLQSGQFFLLKADQLLNDLFGRVGYEINGKTVLFTKDLPFMGVNKVDIKLLTFDISQYSITDDLPIPSDYIAQIEDELMKEFAPVVPESGLVNDYTNIGQTIQDNANSNKK